MSRSNSNDWLQALGIQANPLGIFQPEHPELPGADAVAPGGTAAWGADQRFGPLSANRSTSGMWK